jgi:flavin reductase (DIM6/NTAB) family NADH-FMN oxidoreductase RutF
MPCPLIVGGTLEHADVLTAAWINVISSTPPTMALGLRESRATLQLIRASGSFTVNIPRADMAKQVDFCGLVSGHRADKFAVTKFRLVKSSVIDTPIIAQCPYNLECLVVDELQVGSYVLLLGEIVETHADEDILVSPDGDLIDVEKLDPLVYIAGSREYRRLGGKVADAFNVGRTLIDEDSGQD